MELFPIALGCLFCLVATIVGLTSLVASSEREQRQRSVKIILVGLIGLVPLLMVLPAPYLTMERVSGTYVSDEIEGETTVLHKDGTLDRFFHNDEVDYHYKGTWSIEGSNVIMDITPPPTPGKEAENLGESGIVYWYRNKIITNEDLGSGLNKVSNKS